MKLQRTLYVLALALTVALPSLARADGDLDKFKGKWVGKFGPNGDIPVVIEFKEKKVEITVDTGDGQTLRINGEFKLDEKSSPKGLDFTNFKTSDGNEMEDNKAIYELKDDDTIQICSAGPGNARPKEFFAAEDGGRGTVTLTRKK